MDIHQRYDMYAFIHKGLRKGLCECLQVLSSVDDRNNGEFEKMASKVHEFLDLCDAHVHHENDYIHPSLESRSPGSSLDITKQHDEHSKHIQHLRAELQRIERLPSLRRAPALHRYYREFALFVADNFKHMEHEESELNGALWASYSDEEINAIEENLVAHVDPNLMPLIQGLMVSAMTPSERINFLGSIQPQVPTDIFEAMVADLEGFLNKEQYAKLATALCTLNSPMSSAL